MKLLMFCTPVQTEKVVGARISDPPTTSVLLINQNYLKHIPLKN